jgi:hypothetical protein
MRANGGSRDLRERGYRKRPETAKAQAVRSRVAPTELIATGERKSLELPARVELLASLGIVGAPLSPATRPECAVDISCFKIANALLAAPSLPAFKAAPSARVSL